MQQNEQLDTPVLLVVFNRPEPTRRVFQAIRDAKPRKLYVAADGPRADRPQEADVCAEVRDIIQGVDWECEVETLFREQNRGCKLGVSEAITWFFENEPQGIILEDDCVPVPSFFPYCERLLEKYADDTRIMHIAGTNHHPDFSRDPEYSYCFSLYGHMWGWASWRRAWDMYDVNVPTFPKVKQQKYLQDAFGNKLAAKYFSQKIEATYNGEIDTWDYQWDFIRMTNAGLSIIPENNLVFNIGFGEDATHTHSANNEQARNIPKDLDFPLRHPPFIVRDKVSDDHHFTVLLRRIFKRKLLSFLRVSGYESRG